MKFTAIKVTADGEQISIEGEIDASLGKSLFDQVQPYLQMMDDRLFNMNQRVIGSNYLVKALPAEEQMAVHRIFEHLHGQRPQKEVNEVYDRSKANDAELHEKALKRQGQGNKGPGRHGNA